MKMKNQNYKQTEFIEVEAKVDIAIEKLCQKDLYLFQAGVHERTISHKFAGYLQQEFKGVFSVDCEYNRDGLNTKALEGVVNEREERQKHRIFPDIIVHVRGKNGNPFNKLVIEIKSSNDSNTGDIEKLCGLTSPKHRFNYKYGLFIRFKNNIEKAMPIEELVLEKRWFQNGKKVNDAI